MGNERGPMALSTSEKLVSLDELAHIVRKAREAGRRVAHCHGVFDLLHIGHIKHLEAARRLGDLLVVTVTPDPFVNKGPGRPAFTDQQRCDALAALSSVDYVAVNRWPTAVETLALLQPSLYVKGSEYRQEAQDVTGKIADEVAAVREHGGEVAFTDEVVHSSSTLLNRHVAPPRKEVADFLEWFRERYTFDDIRRYVEGAQKLRVLVVGETIIDEYQYCEAIGKSSKEPTLVAKRNRLERFAGGVLAVANHIADFTENVSLLTMLGALNPQREFVEANLHPHVNAHFVVRKDGPTIVKRRYVEEYFFQKLFELYDLNDVELDEQDNAVLCDELRRLLPEHDLVVVVDYGHGFLSREAIHLLCTESKVLSVNAQCNAGNQGYHTISHYARADFIATTEKEIRLEARSRRGDLKELVKKVSEKLSCPSLCVTRGSNGCLVYGPGGFCDVPAIADRVVDRIGAGDAFLSAAALCVAQDAPLAIAGLVGNAAGAQAVATVCNREPVRRMALLRHLQALLK